MNEQNVQRNNKKGIIFGLAGIATLAVAIVGATFAYFTASANNTNTITGNMATVKLSLAVEKKTTVDVDNGGMIPMSNGMVEAAVNRLGADETVDTSKPKVCVDDNGNAVCQIYKITLTNDSTAAQFVDGYVSLRDMFSAPTTPADIVGLKEPSSNADDFGNSDYYYKTGTAENSDTSYPTPVLMRWAQVFCNADMTSCSTKGEQIVSGTAGDANAVKVSYGSIGEAKGTTGPKAGLNQDNIRYLYTDTSNARGVLGNATIANTSYKVINTNYIRLSNHVWGKSGQTYNRKDDVTSALIFNHNIAPQGTGEYYIVVWLSETGTNQTADASIGTGENAPKNPSADSFFNGNVTFVSAQGSEVSATFSGYAKVPSDKAATS